jgi:bifunctional DNA-binding transcriptional regulator/antitoxin component of YhaV-PrlF toxin-antitoxin module
MQKIITKRQVTLPKALCAEIGIMSGDYIETFEHKGQLTVVKKLLRAIRGSLRHLKPLDAMTDEASCQDSLHDHH